MIEFVRSGIRRKRFDGKRGLFGSLVAIVLSLAVYSCDEEKKSTMANVDPETFPTMMTEDVSTLVSDSGYIRYHLTTKLWLVFDEAKEPRWDFPTGIFMERYDDTLGIEATFSADSATYLSQKRIWQFDRNVRMKNVAGDVFETEQLFWDQKDRKVYSDSFIHIERVDRTIEGYGFESNEQMTEYVIRKVSGIFPAPKKDNKGSGSSPAPAQPAQTDSTVAAPTSSGDYPTRRHRPTGSPMFTPNEPFNRPDHSAPAPSRPSDEPAYLPGSEDSALP